MHVDASFTGVPTGSLDCPYPTLTEGLARLGASSAGTRRLHVAGGLYEPATGEVLPLRITGPMEILGEGAGTTILRGLGDVPEGLDGTIGPSQVAIVVRSFPGPVTLRGLRVVSPRAAPLLMDLGIACVDGNGPFLVAETEGELDEPAFHVDQVAIEGFFGGLTITSTEVAGCHALVTSSSFASNSFGVWMVGDGSYDAGPYRLTAARIGRPGQGNVFENHRVDWQPPYAAAIAAWNRTGGLVIEDNTFLTNWVGVHLNWSSSGLGGREPFVRVEQNLFDDNLLAGVLLYQISSVAELLENDFLGTRGVSNGFYQQSAALSMHGSATHVEHARGNRFVGNARGIHLLGTNLSDAPAPSDFGTAGDPGANELRCNWTDGNPSGGDVVFSSTPVAAMPFEGNGWDHSPPEIHRPGDASPGDDVRLDTVSGVEPALSGAYGSAETCPNGATP